MDRTATHRRRSVMQRCGQSAVLMPNLQCSFFFFLFIGSFNFFRVFMGVTQNILSEWKRQLILRFFGINYSLSFHFKQQIHLWVLPGNFLISMFHRLAYGRIHKEHSEMVSISRVLILHHSITFSYSIFGTFWYLSFHLIFARYSLPHQF